MSHRFEGRTLEDALQTAGQTLGVERWQLTYHVLLEKRGFLGGVKRIVIEADVNQEAPAPVPVAPAAPLLPAAPVMETFRSSRTAMRASPAPVTEILAVFVCNESARRSPAPVMLAINSSTAPSSVAFDAPLVSR